MPPVVGQQAINLIVAAEIGSTALYQAHYQHPVWPGGGSGVTWGVGYDGGQHTADQIAADWGPCLDPDMITLLRKAAGVTGEAAHALTVAMRPVTVPIETALRVFTASTLPRYAKGTDDALDNCDELTPNAFGALVSISYNRGFGGWDMDDDRHKEMAAISDAMTDKNFRVIPDLIRDMQRLWPVRSGLWQRRADESDMFAYAIAP